MESPRRPEAHVIETASWRLLQSLAPEEWIVREVSERDYGIDAYIELLSRDREITGDLMSVQLKGQKWINWTESDGRDRVARSPAVKTATASYWHRFPVPVFLFVADLATKNIYFAPLQEHIRKGFGRLCTQQSVTFPLYDGHDLKSKSGLRLEKAFPVLVRKAIKLVADSEASYWQHHDPVFFKICSSDELDCTLNRIESEACC